MAYGVNAPFGLRPLQSISGGSWTEKTNEYRIAANAAGDATYGVSIFEGDPVVFNPTAANMGTIARYLPVFNDNTPSTFSALPLLGVFISCEYFDVNNRLIQSPFWPANTIIYPNSVIKAYVLDDPDVVFDIQISTHVDAAANVFQSPPVFPNTNADAALKGSFGSNFALNFGGGANFNTVPNQNGGHYTPNPATGNTITGQSAFYLDVSTCVAGVVTHDYNKTVATLPLKAIGYSQNSQNIAARGLTMATTPFLNVRVVINNHVYRAGTAGTTLA